MGKGKNKKVPSAKVAPKKEVPKMNAKGEKYVRYEKNPDSFWDETPKWTFSRIDNEKWRIHEDFIGEILEKLISYEKMTWRDIFKMTRNGRHSNGTMNHNIPIIDLINDAQNRLSELNIYVDELFSLSLDNKKRLWGILDAGVMQIVWYDTEHEICPSTKRFT